jgi:hypothetical protein
VIAWRYHEAMESGRVIRFSRRHCRLALLAALTTSLLGCRGQVRASHTTRVPGFFAYYHEELRALLRSEGRSDHLVDNPASAVRRSGDHRAIILLTESGIGVGIQAHVLSDGNVARTFPVDSDLVDFDLSFRPVGLPLKQGPVVDRCGRFYSEQRNSPAAICRVSSPGAVLARAEITAHDLFSSEDRVYLIGGTDIYSNERCLIYQVRPQGLELIKDVAFPMRGSSEFGGIVSVVDLDEQRGLAVVQPLEHEDNRSNECYLVNLDTGDCASIGRMPGDFGFFLDADVLSESHTH